MPTEHQQIDQTDVIDTSEQDLHAEDLIEEVSIDGMCGVY